MQRRSTFFAIGTTVGTLLLIAVNSQADGFLDKTYLRLDAYNVSGSQSRGEFTSRLMNEGYDFTITKYDVDRTGFQASLGYKWNENLYTELGYLDLGNVRVNLLLNADENQTTFGKSFAKHYPVSGSGLTVVQGYKCLFDDRWSISPELGVFIWKEEVDVEGAQFRVGDKNNTHFLVGVRLDYQLTKSFGVGVGVRSLQLDDAVTLWGISTRWDF